MRMLEKRHSTLTIGQSFLLEFQTFLIGSTNRVAPLMLCASTVARRFCVATLPLIGYLTTNQPGGE